MTLVLDLPPEAEARIRHEANREGVSVFTYVYEMLTPRLRPNAPETITEPELLAKVREDLPRSFWKRFRQLTAKRDTGTLNPDGWKELASSAEAVEAHDAERLLYLIELSRRRGVPVPSLISNLGLRSGSDEAE